MDQTMNLYLVTGTIHYTAYGFCDTHRKEVVHRLVEAENAYQAEIKYRNHYNSKTVQYERTVDARDVDATEIIR